MRLESLILWAVILALNPADSAVAGQLHCINGATDFFFPGVGNGQLNQTYGPEPIRVFIWPSRNLVFKPLDFFLGPGGCSISMEFLESIGGANAREHSPVLVDQSLDLNRNFWGQDSSISSGDSTDNCRGFATGINSREQGLGRKLISTLTNQIKERPPKPIKPLSYRIAPFLRGEISNKSASLEGSAPSNLRGSFGLLVKVPKHPTSVNNFVKTRCRENQFVVKCSDLTAVIMIPPISEVDPAVRRYDDLLLRGAHDNDRSAATLGPCYRCADCQGKKCGGQPFHLRVSGIGWSTFGDGWPARTQKLRRVVLRWYRFFLSWDQLHWFELLGLHDSNRSPQCREAEMAPARCWEAAITMN